jgi:hypothetical protein
MIELISQQGIEHGEFRGVDAREAAVLNKPTPKIKFGVGHVSSPQAVIREPTI